VNRAGRFEARLSAIDVPLGNRIDQLEILYPSGLAQDGGPIRGMIRSREATGVVVDVGYGIVGWLPGNSIGPDGCLSPPDLLDSEADLPVTIVWCGVNRAGRFEAHLSAIDVPLGDRVDQLEILYPSGLAQDGGPIRGVIERRAWWGALVDIGFGIKGRLAANLIGPKGCIAPEGLLRDGDDLPVTIVSVIPGENGGLDIRLAAAEHDLGGRKKQLKALYPHGRAQDGGPIRGAVQQWFPWGATVGLGYGLTGTIKKEQFSEWPPPPEIPVVIVDRDVVDGELEIELELGKLERSW